MVGERLPVLERWHCFACDPKHDKGLRLAFETAGENRLRTEVTLTEDDVPNRRNWPRTLSCVALLRRNSESGGHRSRWSSG